MLDANFWQDKALAQKIIKEKKFQDFKIIKLNIEQNFMNKYLSSYFVKDYEALCNKLNSNFTSLLPIFLNKC